jgi:hypothetical protein
MESSTLSGKPRKILGWAWMLMMLLAAAVAIGHAIWG